MSYTLVVANTGDMNATGMLVGDPLPANTSFYAASGSYILMGNDVVWTVGAVAAPVTTPFPRRCQPREFSDRSSIFQVLML